eukprot:scaffold14565_cov91-Cylindrotheca_fusiformis.AAC.3
MEPTTASSGLGHFSVLEKALGMKRTMNRMILLWHTESNTLEDASILIGRLLRVTTDFKLWRENSDEQLDDGSNCCKAYNKDDKK